MASAFSYTSGARSTFTARGKDSLCAGGGLYGTDAVVCNRKAKDYGQSLIVTCTKIQAERSSAGYLYGTSPDEGTLTPYIDSAFKEGIDRWAISRRFRNPLTRGNAAVYLMARCWSGILCWRSTLLSEVSRLLLWVRWVWFSILRS